MEILTHRKVGVCLIHFFINMIQKIYSKKSISKIPRNPCCIDSHLTNIPLSFQNTLSVFTGLSDIHKLVLTVLKATFVKSNTKELFYTDYKYFNHECFEKDLKYALSTFEQIN